MCSTHGWCTSHNVVCFFLDRSLVFIMPLTAFCDNLPYFFFSDRMREHSEQQICGITNTVMIAMCITFNSSVCTSFKMNSYLTKCFSVFYVTKKNQT